MRGRLAVVLVAVAAALAVGGPSADAECPSSGAPGACEGEGLPVSTLRAVLTAHHGSSYPHPGYTSIRVLSTPEAAYVTVSEPRTGMHAQWLTAERPGNVVRSPWSCARPHQVFHDTITARGDIGATVTAKVTFHAQLSAKWCAAAKAREEAQRAALRRQHEAEARRESEQREAAQREALQREAEQRESVSSCTNGTYVNAAGNTVCKPEESSTAPAGATAECEDGTYSFSESRSGTCSHHGGVRRWLS
ncbi:MAG: DUF3761 domain-containing protein [Solirubrobacteraceae bacterium]